MDWTEVAGFVTGAACVYVPLSLHKGLTLTAVLYAGFVVLCAVGLRQWWRLRDAPAGRAGTADTAYAGSLVQVTEEWATR